MKHITRQFEFSVDIREAVITVVIYSTSAVKAERILWRQLDPVRVTYIGEKR